jgi:hypothetical protein
MSISVLGRLRDTFRTFDWDGALAEIADFN